MIYFLQIAAENNTVHKITNLQSEYNPDFFLGTTFSDYQIFTENRYRHVFLQNIPGIGNTLLDYKNFSTFRNVYEVNFALQPTKTIHFFLEELKPNKYLKSQFFYESIQEHLCL